MMNETLKSYKSDNRGSAIITGLVVSTVLMVLCLSLLLVAYSFFISTYKSTSDLPNREMLYSAAEALEHELLDFSVEYEDDLLLTELNGHDLWQYIDNNIWKGFDNDPTTQDLNNNYWLYFDPADPYGNHSNLEKCSKYFNLTSLGNTKIVVQFYWQLPKGYNGTITGKERKDGTLLNAIYRLYDNKGNLLVRTNRKYIYSISQSSSGSGTGVVVKDVPTSVNFDGGNHYYKYVFDNAVFEINDYFQGANAQFVISSNNNIETSNWMFEVYFPNITNVTFNDTQNYNFIRQPDGWVRISPNETWNNTIKQNQGLYISFNYSGEIKSAPIVRQVIQNSGNQNGGNSSTQTDIAHSEYIQNNGSNNYSGKITITNSLDKAIDNWTVTFNHHGNNFEVLNGNKDHHGQTITITNLNDNGHLEKGQSLDIEFTFKGNGNNTDLYNIKAFTSGSSTTIITTAIKWNRIGEDIINPGGGN